MSRALVGFVLAVFCMACGGSLAVPGDAAPSVENDASRADAPDDGLEVDAGTTDAPDDAQGLSDAADASTCAIGDDCAAVGDLCCDADGGALVCEEHDASRGWERFDSGACSQP